jgi:ABC-2 type transport system permease protein
MTSATSRRLLDGRFEMTMNVTAHKSHAGERELALDEPIELGIFAVDPDDAAAKDILHLTAYRLHSGANPISVIVGREPRFAVIDPYITRVDRNRFDNVNYLRP